jgi:hypothetical protein
MGKNVGLTYGEFKFPAEQGFTGSAGVHKVTGYMRGGHVRSPDKTKGKGKSRAGMPANVKMKGGEVHAGEGGYYGKPGDKYPTLKSGPRGKQGSSMPKNVKNRGGSVHDKLKHEGAKMGYAYGGQVKDTSSEFLATRGKQDTMDHGVQPAQTGRNQAEVEAGGNKRLKAGYNEGGGVHRTAYKKGGTAKKSKGKKGAMKGFTAEQKSQLRKIMKEAGVGALGRGDLSKFLGLVKRKNLSAADLRKRLKAQYGTALKGMKGSISDFERKKMEQISADKKSHGGLHKSASRRAVGTTRSAQGGLAKYSHGGAARKPYTGYNKQPGGSGNEDARYMQPKK